jgi:hypothetical protein
VEECKVEVGLRADGIKCPSVPCAQLLDKVRGEVGAFLKFLVVVEPYLSRR